MVHKENDSFCCKKCGQLFSDAEGRDVHIQNKHTGTLMYEQCGRSFVSRKGLAVHKTTAHQQGKAKYECPICKQGFMEKHHFQGHMNAHSNVTPFKCSTCQKAFRYNSSLMNHMKICKGVTPTLKCNICNSEFSTKSGLDDHKACQHGQEKTYTCPCGATFNWRSTFCKHKRVCKCL